jgi:hypothetical protein
MWNPRGDSYSRSRAEEARERVVSVSLCVSLPCCGYFGKSVRLKVYNCAAKHRPPKRKKAETGVLVWARVKQNASAGLRLRRTDATEERRRREFRWRPAIWVNPLAEVSQEHRPQKEISYDCVP